MRPDDQIQAVRLVRPPDSDAAGILAPIGGDVAWVLMAVAVLAALGVVTSAWLVWSRRSGDPSARAYKRLSRLLRLTRAEQALLREMSGGVKPVALVMSHHAFVRAANRAGGSDPASQSAVSALHAKVFGAGA